MKRGTTLLALLIAALPFAFATIRLIETGEDARYFWLAGAAARGAEVVLLRSRSAGSPTVTRMIVGFAVATVAAGATALLGGANAGLGVTIVSVAFGFCSAAGMSLLARARATR
jgi:hypothetical protein